MPVTVDDQAVLVFAGWQVQYLFYQTTLVFGFDLVVGDPVIEVAGDIQFINIGIGKCQDDLLCPTITAGRGDISVGNGYTVVPAVRLFVSVVVNP